jgi:predicted GH43/DUF377 family glycosyl hydrolase
MTASVFAQGVPVLEIESGTLMPSPRNYNPSIVEFEGRRLMAYRTHRADDGFRSRLAICEMDDYGRAKGNQWLDLSPPGKTVSLEDPRLFTFRGKLHVSFTEARYYGPGKPYTCQMKYARLGRKLGQWQAERIFIPNYGDNAGNRLEKNWLFFESGNALHAIYHAEPHVVLRFAANGEDVEEATQSRSGLTWPWGKVSGGTPPVPAGEGRMITFFHSFLPHLISPHWRRYFSGAYVFEAVAPWRIVACSQRPLLIGSEADGHGLDPLGSTWAPFVVFPGGAIKVKKGWLVSYGINDYRSAIVEHRELALGEPDELQHWGPKYYRTGNGSKPVREWRNKGDAGGAVFHRWTPVPGPAGSCAGVMKVWSPAMAMLLAGEVADLEEITELEFNQQCILA